MKSPQATSYSPFRHSCIYFSILVRHQPHQLHLRLSAAPATALLYRSMRFIGYIFVSLITSISTCFKSWNIDRLIGFSPHKNVMGAQFRLKLTPRGSLEARKQLETCMILGRAPTQTCKSTESSNQDSNQGPSDSVLFTSTVLAELNSAIFHRNVCSQVAWWVIAEVNILD